jgi:hypothetical protein
VKTKRKRGQSNTARIAQRLAQSQQFAKTDYRYRSQSFGAASLAVHINPATVTVTAPDAKLVIEPWWIEIPVDDAFWRVWKMNSMQMRRDGYDLYKIDGKWRAFLVKPSRWHRARGRA